MAGTRARGIAGETLAAAYFELHGASVEGRNVRLAGCEVDLLVRCGRALAVVEVKLRGRGDFGGAAGAVDARKRERLLRAARALLARGEAEVRLDVVTIDLKPEGLDLRHYANAVIEPA
jgi:putative endonuclease